MNNILTYIDQYGHHSFDEQPCNEVDALILAELSYLDFKQLIPFTIGLGGKYLRDLAPQLIEKNTISFSGIMDTSYRKLPGLIKRLKATNRFGSILVSGYINHVVEQEAQQFSAVTFSLNDDNHFIAFRGTDSTIAGWKEDAALSFQKRIPSHLHALRYLRHASHALPGKLILGGHSKGGHLGVHAISFTQAMIRQRIQNVYSFDAPGLHRDDMVERGFLSALPKIKSFIPQESVIGLFLETLPNTLIIKSSQIGMMQHDAFSWYVEEHRFRSNDCLTESALEFQQDIRAWLLHLEVRQREDFFELIFKLLTTNQAKTLRELSKQFPFSMVHILQGYHQLTIEDKNKLKKPIQTFFQGGHLLRKLSLLAHLYPRVVKEK